MKKLSFSENEHNKKKFHDEKMLMKIRAARHENDFPARRNFMKIFIETIHSNLEKSKVKENYSARDKKYSQRKLFECNESDKQSRFQ